MTHAYLSHTQLILVHNMPTTWLIHICRRHDSCMHVLYQGQASLIVYYTYNSFMYTICQRCDSFISVADTTRSCTYHTKGVTHVYVSQPELIHIHDMPTTWLIHFCRRHDSSMHVPYQVHGPLICVTARTHSYTRHANDVTHSYLSKTRLIHTCNIPRACPCGCDSYRPCGCDTYESLICVTSTTHVYTRHANDMTHVYAWHAINHSYALHAIDALYSNVYCSTLQYTTTHCNTLHHIYIVSVEAKGSWQIYAYIYTLTDTPHSNVGHAVFVRMTDPIHMLSFRLLHTCIMQSTVRIYNDAHCWRAYTNDAHRHRFW